MARPADLGPIGRFEPGATYRLKSETKEQLLLRIPRDKAALLNARARAAEYEDEDLDPDEHLDDRATEASTPPAAPIAEQAALDKTIPMEQTANGLYPTMRWTIKFGKWLATTRNTKSNASAWHLSMWIREA